MATERTPDGYRSYEEDFRSHHLDTYGDSDHEYDYYEPAYRHGFRYGARPEHRERDYEALEKELRRTYEEKHGADTYSAVHRATRYGFRQGRRHLIEHSDDAGVKEPTGSSQTASGDPGSFVRQSEE